MKWVSDDGDRSMAGYKNHTAHCDDRDAFLR